MCPQEKSTLVLLFVVLPALFSIAYPLYGFLHGDRLSKLTSRTTLWACLAGAMVIVLWMADHPVNETFDLWTILAIVIGLGAYTSTILMELRKSLRVDTNNAEEHRNNLDWLVPTDFFLMGIGLLVMWAIVLREVLGMSCYLLQVLIDGLFLALLFYFAILHLRQWWIHKE